jgi:NurA-like 5'-3' nuclease
VHSGFTVVFVDVQIWVEWLKLAEFCRILMLIIKTEIEEEFMLMEEVCPTQTETICVCAR